MQDLLEAMKTRRSVRSYTAEPLRKGELEELINLAVLAPSAMNAQPWAFTVVTSAPALNRLDAIATAFLRTPEMQKMLESRTGMVERINDPAYSIFYGAPALIAISADPQSPLAIADCHLAAENLFLAAHGMGLGTCYMGWLMLVRQDPAVRDLLRLPEGHELMVAAIVGHPDVRPDGPPKRNPPRIEWV